MSDTQIVEPTVVTTPPAPEVEETEGPKLYSEDYVKALRQEAAKHRTAKNQAEASARAEADAEWTEKFTATEALNKVHQESLGEAWVELEKLYQAIDAGVPHDKIRAFVGTVKGSDKESIAASVESNKALFGITPVRATDPTQGAGGGKVPPTPLTPDKMLGAVVGAINKRSQVRV